MPKKLTLSRGGLPFLLSADLDLPQAMKESLLKTVGQIHQIHDSALQELAEVNADDRLTNTGKIEARADLSQRVRDRLDAVEQDVKGWRDNADSKERALRDQDPSRVGTTEDRIVAELRGREIRAKFEQLDETMRIPRFHQAITQGDVELIDAVANSPKSFPLIPESELAKGMEKRFEALFPEQTKEIADLRSAHRLSMTAIKAAWTKLKNEGLLPRREGLEEIRQNVVGR